MNKPDPAQIALKSFWEILKNPLFYGPIAGTVAYNSFTPLPTWINAPISLVVAFTEILYWRKNWRYIYEKQAFQADALYCYGRNEELRYQIKKAGIGKLAIELNKAISLKEEIERKILSDKVINVHEKELLANLEEIVVTMLTTAQLDDSQKAKDDIKAALAALSTLNENFDAFTSPLAHKPEEVPSTGLERLTQSLHNRMDEAKEVAAILAEVTQPKSSKPKQAPTLQEDATPPKQKENA
jgi:hypothetical protein